MSFRWKVIFKFYIVFWLKNENNFVLTSLIVVSDFNLSIALNLILQNHTLLSQLLTLNPPHDRFRNITQSTPAILTKTPLLLF